MFSKVLIANRGAIAYPNTTDIEENEGRFGRRLF